MNQIIFIKFYSNKSCHLSEYKLKLFNLAGFLALFFKFGFLVKQFTFLISFSVGFFKMEFKPVPDLLKTEFTITEIGLFYGGEHLEAKILTFWTKWRSSLNRAMTCENTSNTG